MAFSGRHCKTHPYPVTEAHFAYSLGYSTRPYSMSGEHHALA